MTAQCFKMNDISVVPTSKASTAVTMIMLDRLNIKVTKLTNVGQSVYDRGVYNQIMEQTDGESGQTKP